jgi:hypothetical protein
MICANVLNRFQTVSALAAESQSTATMMHTDASHTLASLMKSQAVATLIATTLLAASTMAMFGKG